VKHVLTQGDVLLISYLATLEDQGIYALASNYGGLLARMLFQPVEELSRSYFGKQLSAVDRQPSHADIEAAKANLQHLLRVYVVLSLSAAAVGPTIAPMLLRLVLGQRLVASGAGLVLAKYCYYVPLLAINGLSEAFISAVASQAELNRQSAWMLAFSLGFAAAGWAFLRFWQLGAEGLVWANMVNMALRITWSMAFIKRYFRRRNLDWHAVDIMPRPATAAAAVLTGAVLARMHPSTLAGSARVACVAFSYTVLM
jgi:oligosaccharide translocation protein RFT1